MKTYTAKPKEIEQRWYVVDAEGQTLGRLATRIADTLRGKRKPQYTAHVDTGDFVVVVNAEKIGVTGQKLAQKRYYRHSGYPGGLRSRTLAEQLERRPTEVIRQALHALRISGEHARADACDRYDRLSGDPVGQGDAGAGRWRSRPRPRRLRGRSRRQSRLAQSA
jgi:large subunit ribosomal protein L13